ncbi:MAG: hypothetical protein ACP5NW_02830 [Candidatus Woesearchaeota archaeon]
MDSKRSITDLERVVNQLEFLEALERDRLGISNIDREAQKIIPRTNKYMGIADIPLEPIITESQQKSTEISSSTPGHDLTTAFNHRPVQESSKSQNHSSDSLKRPMAPGAELSLHDIVKYFRASGVIGEEKNAICIYLATANNSSFGVEGPSGSGKTFLVDRLIDLIPEHDLYKIDLSSKMAVFYDADHVNGRSILYFPELQKAMNDKKSPIIEVIKNLTEGKSVKRIVTNSTKTGNQLYQITKGKMVIYTLALENDFKKDDETSRRFMRFNTDSSAEHFEAINNYKAQRRASIDTLTLDVEGMKSKLSEHLYDVRKLKDAIIIDPFAQYLNEFMPQTQKSIGYVDHYYHLVDSCVKFNYKDRTRFFVNGKEMIIADLEDHYQIYNLYYDEFIKSVDELDKSLLDQSVETNPCAKEAISKTMPDWQTCFKSGIKVLGDTLNSSSINKDKIFESWYIHQVSEGKLITKDYLTGKPLEMSMVYKGIQAHNEF